MPSFLLPNPIHFVIATVLLLSLFTEIENQAQKWTYLTKNTTEFLIIFVYYTSLILSLSVCEWGSAFISGSEVYKYIPFSDSIEDIS